MVPVPAGTGPEVPASAGRFQSAEGHMCSKRHHKYFKIQQLGFSKTVFLMGCVDIATCLTILLGKVILSRFLSEPIAAFWKDYFSYLVRGAASSLPLVKSLVKWTPLRAPDRKNSVSHTISVAVRATRALLCPCFRNIYGFIKFFKTLMQRVVRLQQTVSVNVWSRILPQNASQTRCSRLKSTALSRLLPRCHILSFIKTHWNIIMYSVHQMV